MKAAAFLKAMRHAPWYQTQIAHVQKLSTRTALHGASSYPLHPQLQELLSQRGLLPR